MQTDTESPHHKETSMKISDMKPLPTGVFQLEDGCCKWNASEALAVIAFGRMHTELTTKPFGDEVHVFLPSALEDVNFERLWVSNEGKYIDLNGDKQELLKSVFEKLITMRVRENVIIQDTEASKIYVVELEDVEQVVELSV